ADRTFDMAGYVEQLQRSGLDRIPTASQESLDCLTIAENPRLNIGYLVGFRGREFERQRAIRHFVRSWEIGFFLRKPYPGFHPGIYLEQCGIRKLDSNPLAHYMRSGSPAGPWDYEILFPPENSLPDESVEPVSAALHVHVF